ncbi:MAG TPA: NAD(P)H-dependent oxidoreductase [Caulobacteraceae bacterium]
MKHTIILAHPNPQSFNAAVARVYAETVRSFGAEAEVRDLYQMGFDPRLRADELPWAEDAHPRADVIAERERLADTRAFVFVYPLWFNAPPAILKGYVDRVFGMGFGYGPAAGGSEPLLRGRLLLSLTSSGAPDRWVEETGAVKALRHAFDDHVAEVCGLSVLDHVHFGGLTPGIRPDVIEGMLNQVGEVARRHFAPANAH